MKTAIVVLLLLVSASLLSSCQPASLAAVSETASPAFNFRSDQYHVSAETPRGWSTAEGPQTITNASEGEIAFNSWGEKDFWTQQVRRGNSLSYSPVIAAAEIRPGGAYVALSRIWGPPSFPPYNMPEYEDTSLMGLLTPHDWRKDGSGVTNISFYLWGQSLDLEVYCSENATDETLSQLNALLKSWRFDATIAGDEGWASLRARELLPKDAKPDSFPIQAGSWSVSGRTWTTAADVQGETVDMHFTLSRRLVPFLDLTWYHRWDIDVCGSGYSEVVGESWGLQRGE